MIDLQKKVTDTVGPVIDLGADEYAIHDTVSTKRTITGRGARIFVDPSSERDHPAIVLRGDHPRLLGLVQLVGPTTTTRPGIVCTLPDGSQVITGMEEAKHLGCEQ